MKILAAILILMPLRAEFQQPDAMTVMSRCREKSLVTSLSASVSLTITEKNGTIRSRTVRMSSKSYAGGLEKRLIRFIDPPDVRGTAMLIFDNKEGQDEMWIYLPALKKTRRLASSDKGRSFMSSEFTNSDMSSPSTEDFNNAHAPGSSAAGRFIIESKPVNDDKADEYGYSRKLSYINPDTWVAERIEFFDFENKLFKVIEITGTSPAEGDKYIVTAMSASNLSNGRKSSMKMSAIEEGPKVEDSLFTLQNLER